MPQKYKLLLSDIDGTLTDSHGVVSSIDQETLQQITKTGIKITLCTGRPAIACADVLEKVPAEGYHIFFDGALVCNGDLTKTVFNSTFDKKHLSEICNLAHLDGVTLELFSPTGYFVEHKTPLATIHSQFLGLDFKLTDFAKLCEQEPIIMGCLVLPAAEEKAYKPVLKEFGSRKGVKFSWATYAACPEFRFVNITMADVSKERALRLLCSHLKISLDEVAAICDSANSVSLLEIAGLAIVMQTSPPELKAVSDQVTSAVEYNGFSQAIQEFIL